MNTASDLQFKFKFVRERQAIGLMAKKGYVTNQGLTLDNDTISYSHIAETAVRGRRMVIVLSPRAPLSKNIAKVATQERSLILEIYKPKIETVEKQIDRMRSRHHAALHREQLTRAGRGDEFRAVACPHCEATIDLSEIKLTPYIYCRFCGTVFTPKKKVVTSGDTYTLCDECGMFARVRPFTEFYFYFLLVVYGFSYKTRHLCDNCAHKLFLKELLRNFIFILGLFPTFYLKLKSLTGRNAIIKSLDKANALSLKGQYQDAAKIFPQLYEKFPEHPGLRTNEGMGHLLSGDTNGSLKYFERSVKVCSTYLPAYRAAELLRKH